MTLASLPSVATESHSADHGVRTTLADRSRATVRILRDLDSAGVAALERLLDEHYSAGRRFLRISVAGVRQLSTPLIALLERTHYRMLARRGTSIITGAGPQVMRELRELELDEVLLVVETCADERAPH
jgi:anti-anti-sigma regulatory factor